MNAETNSEKYAEAKAREKEKLDLRDKYTRVFVGIFGEYDLSTAETGARFRETLPVDVEVDGEILQGVSLRRTVDNKTAVPWDENSGYPGLHLETQIDMGIFMDNSDEEEGALVFSIDSIVDDYPYQYQVEDVKKTRNLKSISTTYRSGEGQITRDIKPKLERALRIAQAVAARFETPQLSPAK